jgi:hypothetical protein
MAVLVCHTEGCENNGVPIEMDITDPDTGLPPSAVACGACMQPITDVT